jgi:hypothetical protein
MVPLESISGTSRGTNTTILEPVLQTDNLSAKPLLPEKSTHTHTYIHTRARETNVSTFHDIRHTLILVLVHLQIRSLH